MTSKCKLPIKAKDIKVSIEVLSKKELNTEFCKAELWKTARFGEILIINGIINSAETDEHIYSSHILSGIVRPKSILVMGGGNGGVVREIKKRWPKCKITLVDIDKKLSAWIRKNTKNYPKNVFQNVETNWKCILEFFNEDQRQFDVVINDLVDPTEGPLRTHWAELINTAKGRAKKHYVEQLGHPIFQKESHPQTRCIPGWRKDIITCHVPSFFGRFDMEINTRMAPKRAHKNCRKPKKCLSRKDPR